MARSDVRDGRIGLATSRNINPWFTADPLPSPPSSEGFFDSKYSPQSATASLSTASERKRRSSSGTTQDFAPQEQPWGSSLPLDTSRDSLDSGTKKPKGPKAKVHIKPRLKMLSRDDTRSVSIDLSRSSFEQEGLGIYTRERGKSDSLGSIPSMRNTSGYHNRSTSGASQLSASSAMSVGKPGTECVHPMRQIPRSYTPPLSHSYQTSVAESDDLEREYSGGPEGRSSTDHFQPFERASSLHKPGLSVQTQDGTYTRSAGIPQNNLAGWPSLSYSKDNAYTVDTTSPTSRSSLDFVFRSRTRTSVDPISRAATVQAARQAFEEKEAEKARKFEKQQIKAEKREFRRKERQHLRKTSKEDPPETTGVVQNLSEKGKPSQPSDPGTQTPGTAQSKSRSWKSQSKSTWVLFMTWLRTRVFKLRRRMRKLR